MKRQVGFRAFREVCEQSRTEKLHGRSKHGLIHCFTSRVLPGPIWKDRHHTICCLSTVAGPCDTCLVSSTLR